ncbi:MAG: CPBP family intramembrane glutamic endopeptidase [Desulfobaccales bacterium]
MLRSVFVDIKRYKSWTSDAAWTIRDIVIITLCVYIGAVLIYISLLELFGDNKTIFRISKYMGAFLEIYLPIFWIKKKYGLPKEVLGLRKGSLTITSCILIGIVGAIVCMIIYFILIQIIPFRSIVDHIDIKTPFSPIYLLLLPISISGFSTIILTPIGEEIMTRGFLYGYVRKKLGVNLGLFLQALLFTLFHFDNFIYGNFLNGIQILIVGLILGFLYERTGSLYPSMVCHGMINYLSIIHLVWINR